MSLNVWLSPLLFLVNFTKTLTNLIMTYYLQQTTQTLLKPAELTDCVSSHSRPEAFHISTTQVNHDTYYYYYEEWVRVQSIKFGVTQNGIQREEKVVSG